MRSWIFITLAAVFLTGVVPNGGDSQLSHKTMTAKVDTNFILKEKTGDYYHIVFIERNRKSEYYNRLMDFSMSEFGLQDYKGNLTGLKKRYPKHLKKYNLPGLPKEWIPLYAYKGKYYVYIPMEAGELGRKIITDSTLIYWFMDGRYPERIQSFKKTGKNVWNFQIHSPYIDQKNVQIIIHIIDPINQIAIWENTGYHGNGRYELYIPKNKAKNFDVIVNECKQGKLGEFNFDSVDYRSLLKSKP